MAHDNIEIFDDVSSRFGSLGHSMHPLSYPKHPEGIPVGEHPSPFGATVFFSHEVCGKRQDSWQDWIAGKRHSTGFGHRCIPSCTQLYRDLYLKQT